eukprot:Seg1319.7 transcript_id=Seg1319.7/GoldUCD/mRNA.D3Y31 product="hypothetical protein" protein_id=Seg1319.7/GoldUCD/D3Y31
MSGFIVDQTGVFVAGRNAVSSDSYERGDRDDNEAEIFEDDVDKSEIDREDQFIEADQIYTSAPIQPLKMVNLGKISRRRINKRVYKRPPTIDAANHNAKVAARRRRWGGWKK